MSLTVSRADPSDHWNALYEATPHPWGLEPSPLLVTFAPRLKVGRVLDLGSGDGRHSLFLANRGHTVHATDISQTALRTLRREARAQGIHHRITTSVAAHDRLRLRGQYDTVVSVASLQFLPSRDAVRFFNHLIEHTKVGGIHFLEVFAAYGPDGPVKADANLFHITADQQLQELYESRGFTVLQQKWSVRRRRSDAAGNAVQVMSLNLAVRKNPLAATSA